MRNVLGGGRRGDFLKVMSDAALAASDMATHGIGGAFAPGAHAESFGRPSDAFGRLERAMAAANAAAARAVAAGRDAVDAEAAHGLAPGAADGFYADALDAMPKGRARPACSTLVAGAAVGKAGEEGRGMAARAASVALASLARARHAAAPLARFVADSTVAMVGGGAPDAVGRIVRRTATLGLVAGVGMAVVPSQANAWVPGGPGNGGQRAGVPVRMGFQAPAQRFQAAPVIVQRTAPSYANNGNRGWGGGDWGGAANGNGWNGTGGPGWAGRPRPGAAIAGFVAGAVLGAVVGQQAAPAYGQPAYPAGGAYPQGGYPQGGYPAPGQPAQGYAAGGYGANPQAGYAGQGYRGGQEAGRGLGALPPSDHIMAAAKLMVAMDTGSYEGAAFQVDEAVRLGLACSRHTDKPCIVDAAEFHFDFREGVYGVKRNGVDVAVETAAGYRALAPQLIRDASARAQALRASEARTGPHDASGAYEEPEPLRGPGYGR